jgi:carboxyl-terminal processing protease
MHTEQELHPQKAIAKKIPLLGLFILIATIAGLAVDVSKTAETSAKGSSFYNDVMRFNSVAIKVHQDYVEDIDSKLLIDHAIEGMFDVLDPHSVYFTKKQFDELMIQTEGKFGGLGIQISIREKILTVMTPMAGTPAERIGLQAGDQIIKINGKSTAGITVDEAVNKLRGEPGTDVNITIRRSGEKDLDYTITRETIKIKSVPYYDVFNDSIGYVALKIFSQDAGDEVGKAVNELLKKNVKGIILDLRFNPGGLLPQAIEVANKFLAKKSLVVYTRGRMQGQNQTSYVTENPLLPNGMPLIVLVNYASASASEIVSGAIQDWDKGLIVGDTTFGKGSVQSLLPINDDYHLKLTTAFYYTPSGRCINKPENGIRAKDMKNDDVDSSDDADDDTTAQKAKSNSKKDTTTYKTNGGRIVHGGGGIVPDTVIKQELPAFIVRSLFLKDVFFSFVNVEYLKLKERHIKVDGHFEVTDDILADFQHYLDSTKFKSQNPSQTSFDDFKVRAGLVPDTAKKSITGGESMIPKLSAQEKEELRGVADKIEAILKKENKREFSDNAVTIRKYLKETFLAKEFGQDNENVYRAKLTSDNQFQAALDLLKHKDVYKQLLKPKAN